IHSPGLRAPPPNSVWRRPLRRSSTRGRLGPSSKPRCAADLGDDRLGPVPPLLVPCQIEELVALPRQTCREGFRESLPCWRNKAKGILPKPFGCTWDVMEEAGLGHGLLHEDDGYPFSLQRPAPRLFAFDGLEQRLEVTLAEAARPVALDDFEEQRGPILDRFGKDLQQIAFI